MTAFDSNGNDEQVRLVEPRKYLGTAEQAVLVERLSDGFEYFAMMDSIHTFEEEITDIVTPLGKRVMVRRVEPEFRSAGGLYLLESTVEPPLQGVVLKLGKGRSTPRVKAKKGPHKGFYVAAPQQFGPDVGGTFFVKPGDKVLLDKEEIRANHAALQFCHDKDLWIVNEAWVLGVLE